MQGPNYLDLAKTLADGHYREQAHHSAQKKTRPRERQARSRERVGHALISLGERLAPGDAQLKMSTGPPC